MISEGGKLFGQVFLFYFVIWEKFNLKRNMLIIKN